jgi:hypothetical protein
MICRIELAIRIARLTHVWKRLVAVYHGRCFERTMPTERSPLVDEVTANFLVDRGVSRGQCVGSLRP